MSIDYNLNSHYSSNSKVNRPQRVIVTGPNDLPKVHLYNDRDATNRVKAINNDIVLDYKQEKNKDGVNFTKGFVAIILGILAFLGIKKVIK